MKSKNHEGIRAARKSVEDAGRASAYSSKLGDRLEAKSPVVSEGVGASTCTSDESDRAERGERLNALQDKTDTFSPAYVQRGASADFV